MPYIKLQMEVSPIIFIIAYQAVSSLREVNILSFLEEMSILGQPILQDNMYHLGHLMIMELSTIILKLSLT